MFMHTLDHAGALLHNGKKDFWPFVSVGLVGLVIAAMVVTFTVIMFILVRAKSKVQEELKQSKACALYDEIGIPPSVIDSNKNVAYVSTLKRVDEKST